MSYGYAGYGSPAGYRTRCSFNHRDLKPVPPLEDYEAYRDTLDLRVRKQFNCRRYRRAAQLRREGYSQTEALRLAGFRSCPGSYFKMPEELR
jgi:hypothetical protein